MTTVLHIVNTTMQTHYTHSISALLTSSPFQLIEANTDTFQDFFVNNEKVAVIMIDHPHAPEKTLYDIAKMADLVPDIAIVAIIDDQTYAIPAIQHGAQEWILRSELSEKSLIFTLHCAIHRQQRCNQVCSLHTPDSQEQSMTQLKNSFIVTMSHELRTPLHGILGMAETLQEEVYGPVNVKQRSSLNNIEQNGRMLLEKINDMLDLAKIEAGKFVLNIGIVSIENVCKTSMNNVFNEAHAKRLHITQKIDEKIGTFEADPRRLVQILTHLLRNAIKFTPEEGNIGIIVAGDKENQCIRFTIWDTGIGIATEDMTRIFESFVQLDSHITRRYDGIGLGLSLAAHLTHMHGGAIQVSSEIGKGSQFTLLFPCNKEVERCT